MSDTTAGILFIAAMILARFPVRRVEVELRKYILPDTAFVAVRLSRTAE